MTASHTTASHEAADEQTEPAQPRLWTRIPFVVILVLVAFVLRAVAAVIVEQILYAVGRNGFVGLDDLGYDRVSWRIAQAWAGTGPPLDPGDAYLLNAFTYTEAALYWLIGHQPLAMKLLNCAVGALTAGLIYLITRQIFGVRAATLSGIAAAFFPSTFLWSLMNLKDAMFLFFTAIVLWALTMVLTTGYQLRFVAPLFLAFIVVGSIRIYIQVFLSLLIPFTLMLQLLSRRAILRKSLATVVVVAGCAGILWWNGGWQWFRMTPGSLDYQRYAAAAGAQSAYIPTPVLNVAPPPIPTNNVATTVARATTERSLPPGSLGTMPAGQAPAGQAPAGLSGTASSTGLPATAAAEPPTPTPVNALTPQPLPPYDAPPERALRNILRWLPMGVLYTLAAPFPWAAHRTIERVTIPEMVVWYLAMALAIIGAVVHWRRWRQYIHLLGYVGGTTLIFAIISGNLGTLIRTRGMLIPFTLVFSGAGAAWLWSRWGGSRLIPLPAWARRIRQRLEQPID